MNDIDFVFWTEVLKKQQQALDERIEDYIQIPQQHKLYLIKANALHISLTAERIAALEGVKL